MADWKDRLGVLYSTNPDFVYETTEEEEPETLPAAAQMLRLSLSRKGRAGKDVTLVSGFVGRKEDLGALAKRLKQGTGVGGSVKDGEILIQGDQREKLRKLLASLGYPTKG